MRRAPDRIGIAQMIDPRVALGAEHALEQHAASSRPGGELARSPDVASEPQAVPDERNIPGTSSGRVVSHKNGDRRRLTRTDWLVLEQG